MKHNDQFDEVRAMVFVYSNYEFVMNDRNIRMFSIISVNNKMIWLNVMKIPFEKKNKVKIFYSLLFFLFLKVPRSNHMHSTHRLLIKKQHPNLTIWPTILTIWVYIRLFVCFLFRITSVYLSLWV